MATYANRSVNPDQISVCLSGDASNESESFIPPSPPANMSPKKPQEATATGPLSTLNQHLTTAAHACALLFFLLITYLCISGEFVFFTWHPLLLSFGWMFVMTEAILSISKDNLFTGTLPKKVRVRLHWIFLTLAVILILIGFLVVYTNKNHLDKEHFKTWHAFFGLIAIICSIPTCLNGIIALYHGDLKNYIHPRYSKLLHIGSGVLTFFFGGLTLVLSVYSKWFERATDHNSITFVLGVALAAYPVFWTLIKPANDCFNRFKMIIKTD